MSLRLGTSSASYSAERRRAPIAAPAAENQGGSERTERRDAAASGSRISTPPKSTPRPPPRASVSFRRPRSGTPWRQQLGGRFFKTGEQVETSIRQDHRHEHRGADHDTHRRPQRRADTHLGTRPRRDRHRRPGPPVTTRSRPDLPRRKHLAAGQILPRLQRPNRIESRHTTATTKQEPPRRSGPIYLHNNDPAYSSLTRASSGSRFSIFGLDRDPFPISGIERRGSDPRPAAPEPR